MVVFSNLRLGPSAELLVADDVARVVLHAIAEAARPFASARWEHELVRFLGSRAAAAAADGASPMALDVGHIAWTPDHFEAQRTFLLDAIRRAAASGDHAVTVVLDRLRRLVEAHPARSVQVGRRWQPIMGSDPISVTR